MKSLTLCMTFLLVAALPAKNHSESQQPPQSEVWFTPNQASVDMLDLFSTPEQWESARSRIDVFKFYAGQVGTDGWSCDANPAQNCGSNYIDNFIAVDAFAKLGQWGIGIAIESFFAGPVMAVDPIQCSTSNHVYSRTLDGSINVIQSVEANGGVVRCLAMDEPIRQWLPAYFYIHTGQTDPRPCLVDSIGVLADHMAAYLQQMAVWFPTIPIGHIELYPEVSVDMFKEWILALEARGVSIPFLHLDVNGPRVDQYIGFGFDIDLAADFMELKTFLNARGIEFGVIFTDVYWNSQLWEPGTYTDQTYYDGTMAWVNTVAATNVSLDHIIFQSWVMPYYTTGAGPKEVPVNLPEDSASIYSHTRLINDALDVVVAVADDPAAEGPPSAVLYQNHPNPFGSRTIIEYELLQSSKVTLGIYDVRGRAVRTLVNAVQEPGVYSVDLVARGLPAGVYFSRLKVDDRHIGTKKILLVK
jgi:hypothetical protein